jgi:uncharacterized phage-associated protein
MDIPPIPTMAPLGPTATNELTSDQLDKVGNAIIYLAERITPLYKTKVLKLLYLLDEASVKEAGIPMFALEYRAWRMGPVSKEIYVDIDDGPHLLKKHIRVVRDEHGDRVEPAKPFDDGEFSDRDMRLMERIVPDLGRRNARDLVDITHDKDSLWYQLAKENDLLDAFQKEQRNTSDVVLDLERLVANDPIKRGMYADHQEFLRNHRALNG